MIENLMRLREPAAWVMVGVTAASIVLALVRFVLALTAGGSTFAAAAQDVALQAMGLTLVVVLVALVLACVFPVPVAGVRRLVGAATAVVTVGTVLTVLGALLGLSASAGTLAVVLELLGGLLDIVVKIVGMVTLWLILRGVRAGRIGAGESADADAAAGVVASPDADPGLAQEPGTAGAVPTWTPDAATGSVWMSASDAAAGAQPSGLGVPGDGSGWHPVARPEGAAASPDEGEAATR